MQRFAVIRTATAMLAAAGATVAIAGDSELATGTAAARIDWSKCGARLECARVRVPLDWDRPDVAKITLKVIRHLASRPAQPQIAEDLPMTTEPA